MIYQQDNFNNSKTKNQIPKRFTKLQNKNTKSLIKHVGKYQISSKIGQGCNGHVYLAQAKDNFKKLAVKITPLTEGTADQVQRQIQILSSINHKNIVKFQEVIRIQNKAFIFMELCIKSDLFSYIQTNGFLTQSKAMKIFIKTYFAVLYLHHKGIAHRDIKAQNILLNQNLEPKLTDFGLSRFYEKQALLDTWCGTFNYIAPQIIKKKKYKAELVDLWSLCVTLYIMLTGQKPFKRQSEGIIKKHLIIGYDWLKNDCLSSESIQLFNSVFVPPQHRIKLQDVRNCSLFKKYEKQVNFQSLQNQNYKQAKQQIIEFSTQLKMQNKSWNVQFNSLSNTQIVGHSQASRAEDQLQIIASRKQKQRMPISKLQLIKMFKRKRNSKSVEPSNKFRIKSTIHNFQQ